MYKERSVLFTCMLFVWLCSSLCEYAPAQTIVQLFKEQFQGETKRHSVAEQYGCLLVRKH